MAAEHSIQCDSANNGCNGGYVPKALDFMKKEGTVPLDCKSYREESPRRCTNTCDDQAKITDSIKFNIQSYESLNGTDKIKSSIYNYGSVVASYKVYICINDFLIDIIIIIIFKHTLRFFNHSMIFMIEILKKYIRMMI